MTFSIEASSSKAPMEDELIQTQQEIQRLKKELAQMDAQKESLLQQKNSLYARRETIEEKKKAILQSQQTSQEHEREYEANCQWIQQQQQQLARLNEEKSNLLLQHQQQQQSHQQDRQQWESLTTLLKEQQTRLDSYQFIKNRCLSCDLYTTIQQYIQKNQSAHQDEALLKQWKQELDDQQNQSSLLETQLNQFQQCLDQEQRQQVNLTSLLKFKSYETQLASLQNDIQIQEKILQHGSLDHEQQSLANCQEKIQQATGQLNAYQSELHHLEESIKELTEELTRPEYKEIDIDYKRLLVQLSLLQTCLNDLNLYKRVIDLSLAQYHQSKIEEINRRLKDLWMSTYQGGDIEYIELMSEVQSTDHRPSYKYSMNMVKNSVSLPMKARCSAGQKALASILLRLVLAETFCGTSCGLLTLDEPTTNLDEENKKSLAESLLTLLAIRQQQKNFQLIVITHDEEFAQWLTQANEGDTHCYWRLSREESKKVRGVYYSTITQQSWGL